jgi:hypothetical protein
LDKHKVIYRPLADVIPTHGLTFNQQTYRQEEREILQPRLEHIGYTQVYWQDGDRDSFGPLTRVCSAIDPYGDRVYFVYG